MNRYSFVLLSLILFASCAPPATQSPDTPVDNYTPSDSQPNDLIPGPDDGKLLRGEVYLDSVDLLTMESYPPQFSLSLQGSLPTPCHKLRVAVSQPDADNKIAVEVYSVADPDAICVQMLEPFSVNFPLGSFPTGHYTLWVNGRQAAAFDA